MAVVVSVILDFILGDPKGFPHPIRAVGKVIGGYERLFYRGNKKIAGCLFTAAVLATVAAVLGLLLWGTRPWPILHTLIGVYLLYTALAWRSLKKETGYVFQALAEDDIAKARKMTSYVVGRDTENLTASEMIKACVETIGENTIDGVIAPLFYMMIGYIVGDLAFADGIGGAVLWVYIYKTINTLDSMVGYKNDRYADFGFAAAKIDDVVNWVPARFGSLLMLVAGALCGFDIKNGWRIFRRDRFNHTSPNSAQSESVYAGLLGLELGGAHDYFGKRVEKPTIGDALREPELQDHRRSSRIMDVTVVLMTLPFALCYLAAAVRALGPFLS